MAIGIGSVTTHRVNWEHKSANLVDVAASLQLSLDSFLFIDDDAIEVEAMRSALPAVTTVHLPPADAEHVLRHHWALDSFETLGLVHNVHSSVASAAPSERSMLYRQQLERQKCQRDGKLSFCEFLASLQLSIELFAMEHQHLARVHELSQRTNQFNSTTIRYTERQVAAALHGTSVRVMCASVSDRFGEYGLVGAAFYSPTQTGLHVQAFMMSCRVLGRGVEHAMVRELARTAVGLGVADPVLELEWAASVKNAKLLAFFRALEAWHPATQLESTTSGQDSRSTSGQDLPTSDPDPSTSGQKSVGVVRLRAAHAVDLTLDRLPYECYSSHDDERVAAKPPTPASQLDGVSRCRGAAARAIRRGLQWFRLWGAGRRW